MHCVMHDLHFFTIKLPKNVISKFSYYSCLHISTVLNRQKLSHRQVREKYFMTTYMKKKTIHIYMRMLNCVQVQTHDSHDQHVVIVVRLSFRVK